MTPLDETLESAPTTTGNPEVAERIVVDRAPVIEANPTRLLVTNDDGVDSPGIVALAQRLASTFDVTIAAPARDSSGSGTGIGYFDSGLGIPTTPMKVGGIRAFAVDGPPGLAVMAAALGAFGGPFPVVVSGINAGINTGQSVIHSGTVGAALTARTFGAHGIAVSLRPGDGPDAAWHWDTAADVGLAITRWLTSTRRPPTAVNVNVPALALDDVRGICPATLDRFGYFRVAVVNEGERKMEFEMSSESERDAVPGSDTWLLRQGFVTVTRLGSVTSDTNWSPAELSDVLT